MKKSIPAWQTSLGIPFVILGLAVLILCLQPLMDNAGRAAASIRQLEDPIIEEPVRPLHPTAIILETEPARQTCGNINPTILAAIGLGLYPLGILCSRRRRCRTDSHKG